MHLQDYFARIGYAGPAEPSHSVLAALVRAHVLSIPFENLDVQLGRPLSIDPVAAYNKIVDNNRGGWCYEQNGLFGWALSQIGFSVTRVAAAVRRAQRGDAALSNHLCLLVHISGEKTPWLADVGFGGSMLAPIDLLESSYEHPPYRLGLRRTADNHWQFWEDVGDGEFNYDFLPQAADESALAAKCESLQTSSESSFVLNLVAQKRYPEAHQWLRGKVFRQATSDGIESRVLHSADELVSVLRDVFCLDVAEAAGLWPRIERRHRELEEQGAL